MIYIDGSFDRPTKSISELRSTDRARRPIRIASSDKLVGVEGRLEMTVYEDGLIVDEK